MRTTMSHHVPQHIIPSPAARCEMNCARSSFCFVERASLVANREFKIPETCQHAACASRATRTAQNTTHSFAPSCSCIDRHAHALAREIDSTAAACLISSVGCFLYTCISDPASTTNVSGRSAAATPRLAADDRRNWLTHAMQPRRSDRFRLGKRACRERAPHVDVLQWPCGGSNKLMRRHDRHLCLC